MPRGVNRLQRTHFLCRSPGWNREQRQMLISKLETTKADKGFDATFKVMSETVTIGSSRKWKRFSWNCAGDAGHVRHRLTRFVWTSGCRGRADALALPRESLAIYPWHGGQF